MTRAALMTAAMLAVVVSPAAAQTTSTPPGQTEFLTRFDFYAGIEKLFAVDDPRFVWDADFSGDVDLIDYGVGRTSAVAVYEVMLGREFRAFDPHQSNYTLAVSSSVRTGPAEVAVVFHHVSRHLGDRARRFSVDWNMLGGRVSGRTVRGRTDVQTWADLRGTVRKGYVDYRWELDTQTRAHVAVRPNVDVIAGGGLRVVGVDGSRDRGTQYGWRGEGGVRLKGRGAGLDLFVAAERRIDPYQLEFSTLTWVTTGFRIVSP